MKYAIIIDRKEVPRLQGEEDVRKQLQSDDVGYRLDRRPASGDLDGWFHWFCHHDADDLHVGV